VPIIASVSEHQPTSWPTYIMDLHVLILMVPAGIVVCFHKLTDGSAFLVIYTITAVYFSGIMVRARLGTGQWRERAGLPGPLAAAGMRQATFSEAVPQPGFPYSPHARLALAPARRSA
jgi:hypothetical protein